MPFELLHIFRNTPFGRETLMQSAFFCQQMGMPIDIYVPRESQFLMYFEHGVVTVDLDRSYLRSPESAHDHAREIVESLGLSKSRAETRRLVKQRAVSIDGEKVEDPTLGLRAGTFLLRVGRRRFARVTLAE